MQRARLAATFAAFAIFFAAAPAAAAPASAASIAGDPATAPAITAKLTTVPPPGPPACNGVYKDVLTPLHGYGDWQLTLVDTIYMVPASYSPPDLVSTGVRGGGLVRKFVRSDLLAMTQAAASAGAPLQVQSAYRSYSTQVWTFNYWVSVSGRAAALKSSARPGHSEHQLGTAIDFTSAGGAAPWNYADWATTRAGAWMAKNAWRYGFVMTYPKGKSPTSTCYIYEPWHYRYVGKAAAKAIHDTAVTSRQYLWTAWRRVSLVRGSRW